MKLIPFLCSFFLLAAAQAQDAPGRVVLGGSFGYSNNAWDYTGPPGTNFESYNGHNSYLDAYLGFPLSGLWTLGLKGGIRVGYGSQYNSFFDKLSKDRSAEFSVGIFARRHFRTDKRIQFFLEPGVAYSHFDRKNNSNFTNTHLVHSKQFSAYTAPGLLWAVSKRFNLLARFARLNYAKGKGQYSGSDEYKAFQYLDFNADLATFVIGAEFKI